MASVITIELRGFKELGDKLHALGPRIERKGLRATSYAGAKVIRDAIRETHAFRDRSGNLRANMVTARRRSPPKTATYRVTVRWARYRSTKANRLKGKAGKFLENNPALYGKFLEFGTSKMRAHPFLRPAFLQRSDEALEAMRVRLAQAIEDAAR